MKKNLLLIIGLIIAIVLIIGGIIFAYSHNNHSITPSLSQKDEEQTIWVGTFQLAWNDLMDVLNMNILFQDGNNTLAEKLNKREFTKNMLSSQSYYTKVGNLTPELRDTIQKDLSQKWGHASSQLENVVNKIGKEDPNSFLIYAMLKKNFTFPQSYYDMGYLNYGKDATKVRYWGIECNSPEMKEEKLIQNIEVLFYKEESDFALKLNTKEGDELYLYRTYNTNDFNSLYKEMLEKEKTYTGNRNLDVGDKLYVPYIKIETDISYDELCNRQLAKIQGQAKLVAAIQSLKFELNESGGNIESEAIMGAMFQSVATRNFILRDRFVLFMKEKEAEKPYLAIDINSAEFLVKEKSK